MNLHQLEVATVFFQLCSSATGCPFARLFSDKKNQSIEEKAQLVVQNMLLNLSERKEVFCRNHKVMYTEFVTETHLTHDETYQTWLDYLFDHFSLAATQCKKIELGESFLQMSQPIFKHMVSSNKRFIAYLQSYLAENKTYPTVVGKSGIPVENMEAQIADCDVAKNENFCSMIGFICRFAALVHLYSEYEHAYYISMGYDTIQDSVLGGNNGRKSNDITISFLQFCSSGFIDINWVEIG